MRCYIVDDDPNVIRELNDVLEGEEIWTVVGSATRPDKAMEDIMALRPDIVFLDLIMPKLDGIRFVQRVKLSNKDFRFVLLSHTSNKKMLAEAYSAGIDLFISKPINPVEVHTVNKLLSEVIGMERVINDIHHLVSDDNLPSSGIVPDSPLKSIKYLLGVLGMLGEQGTKDILAICEIVLYGELDYNKDTIQVYSRSIGKDSRMVKQRMRRSIKKGLTNVALMGLDDMANEVFQNYSQVVYDYNAIKSEMDFLRGKSSKNSKVSIDKFMEGLLFYYEVDS